MREQIRFAVLGPVSAWRGTAEVDLGPPQQRAVLGALLIAEGAQVRVGELVDALWGTAPPASAVGSVRTYVHRLRRALDDALLIRSVGDAYVVRALPQDLDLAAFRELVARSERSRQAGNLRDAVVHLRAGLALWRGPALSGVRSAWARAQRERLERLRLSALETRLALELDLGGHAQAAPELAALVGAHPLDERFREMLMLALYRSGRQSTALEAYTEARELLAEELGVDPGPGLQRLYERILRADPELLPRPAAPTPAEPAQGRADRVEDLPAAQEAAVAVAVPGAAESGVDDSQPVREASAHSCPPAIDRTSPTPPVPAQLPAALAGFVGRDDQLAQATALLPEDGDAPSVTVLVGGTAGVGKTAFAVHWARRIAARFPDGQLYVNLRGFDPVTDPVSPGQALRTLLAALGADQRELPQDEDALAARLRTVLTGRRVLILLDNARDAGQVRPLLPGAPGCLTIVTSRNRLGGLVAVDGAHPVHLDVLSAREGHELLVRRLGAARVAAEPKAVRMIVELCAGLPLALAVTAARAAGRPAFPLAALAAELAEGHGSLDAFTDTDQVADVRTVLSWSYQALSPAAARLFRLLALHPGPDVSPAAAASLAGLGLPATRNLLTELVHTRLVDEPAPGRYASHDLLRAHAGELAAEMDSPEELTAARRRMLDHYLHGAHAAAELTDLTRDRISLREPSDGVRCAQFSAAEQATAWFETERAVLVAVLRQASAHHFDVHAWQLAWCVEHYLGRQGLWHELGVTLRTALVSAERLGDPTALAHIHRGLAQAESYAKHIKEAHRHIERAIALFGEVGDLPALTECHRQFSVVLEVQGDLEGALEHHRLALELVGPDDSRLRSWILNGLGWYHTLLGRHREALMYCASALRLARAADDDYTLGHVLNSTGTAHHHLGAHEDAVAAFEESLLRFRQVGGVPWAEAHTLASLAETRSALGQPERARALLREAVRILDGIRHPDAGPLRAKVSALAVSRPAVKDRARAG
ncbi:DNA-binding SARP family transcriptional activator [Streptomyces sp. TLI_55]|uniref:AfsR/SARP family transcriptional regulator n=1 Tax=Streptomyces sp. TLI_55 TaxID=1938861 RepID=UPI000BD4B65C|nr:BTAD domain-containing putative transcriptional regulator [Streptomyces sp. TLI_55]SNX66223.1 DNA-binding SARP family transcriptional activator [Streptomyces sp. TLI_55]